MNQLTNQEIAKVFAMYLGQKISFDFSSRYVEFKQPETRYGLMKGVDGIQLIFHPITRNGLVDRMSSDRFGVASGKLILTPLSRITDEDSIEVSKLQDWKDYAMPLSNDDKRGVRDNIIVLFKYDWVNYTTVQFLMNNGYDIPLFFTPNHWANGKTAIELGIAIEKSTTPQQ